MTGLRRQSSCPRNLSFAIRTLMGRPARVSFRLSQSPSSFLPHYPPSLHPLRGPRRSLTQHIRGTREPLLDSLVIPNITSLLRVDGVLAYPLPVSCPPRRRGLYIKLLNLPSPTSSLSGAGSTSQSSGLLTMVGASSLETRHALLAVFLRLLA